MKPVMTDFGVIPVADEDYDELNIGGLLHQALLKELDSIWKYYPTIKLVSVGPGRLGLWGNGEMRKCIMLEFTAKYAVPTEFPTTEGEK